MSYSPSVFVVHHGKAEYLGACLRHAKSTGHNTYLIGDSVEESGNCDLVISDQKRSHEYDMFLKNYEHLSTNSQEFELLCFKRYFLLLDAAKKKQVYSFWMIDSDVILLKNLYQYQSYLENAGYQVSLSVEEDQRVSYSWAASPHISYWTIDSLSSFVQFLMSFYQKERKKINEKYDFHKINAKPGGICDMTALFLWSENSPQLDNNLYAHKKGYGFFDHNMNQRHVFYGEEVDMLPILKVKKILSSGSEKYIRLKCGRKYEVTALHFQGGSKQFIASLEAQGRLSTSSMLPFIVKKVIKSILRSC